MDKYEFNIKVEQIKKLVNKGDYETAMKIADTIDWRRVRSTSLLTMVAQVYERNEEYQDAKDILLLAFERAPIGKGLLFKLTDLALREGNISEAEAYYREFCDLSSDDPRQYLLRYLILEAKEAPVEQLINSLERYSQEELDEKWLYKLAELYNEAGNEDACVRICDKIMLMFGLGKYVDKAMELKLQHAPLTDYQMDLVENREKYEEKLRAVEQRFGSGAHRRQEENDFDEGDEADEYEGAEEPEERGYDSEEQVDEIETGKILEEDLIVKFHEEEAEQDLAKEMSLLEPGEEAEAAMGETRVLGDMRNIKQFRPAEEASWEAAASQSTIAAFEKEMDTIVEDWDLEPEEEIKNHLMIESEDAQSGLELALESLKKIHAESGSKNPIAKISGENLNKRGVFAVSERLAGKDLLIERAADLSEDTVTELCELMDQDTTGMIVVLIDTPNRMERLHNRYTGLANKFQYIGCDKAAEEKEQEQQDILRLQAEREAEMQKRWEAEQQESNRRQTEREAEEQKRQEQYEAELRQKEALEEERRLRSEREIEERRHEAEIEAEQAARIQAEREADEAVRQIRYEEEERRREEEQEDIRYQAAYETGSEQTEELEPPARDDHEEMDVEEFAQYACQYAAEIDCSISGKSMLALYERAEMMEEDGIPLTKANAEDLLEEAADRAEKRSFGGLFSSKYDKDGLLILKEKHFFD